MRDQRQAGLTLLEVLLALSLSALLMISAANLLSSAHNGWTEQNAIIAGYQDAQLVLELLANHIRQAAEIELNGKSRLNIVINTPGGKKERFSYQHYYSAGVPALGMVKRGGIQPVLNGVKLIEFEDINGDMSLIKITLELVKTRDSKIRYQTLVAPRKRGVINYAEI